MAGKKDRRGSFAARAFRAGAYSTFAAVVVLAIAIAVNVGAGYLPDTATKFDLTDEDLYTLTDKTARIVTSLEDDVEIFILSSPSDATSSKNTDLGRIADLLERYEALSGHIDVRYVDPAVYPRFASTYTDKALSRGSLIVNCPSSGRSRAVDYSEIVVETPQYRYSAMQGQYVQTGVSKSFDGENRITSAVNYVSSSDMPLVCLLTGHGESDLPQLVREQIENDNYEIRTLSLLTEQAVPDGCGAVIVCAPVNDLNRDEAQALTRFMRYADGDVILLTDIVDESKMANLLSLTASVNMAAVPGMLCEADPSRYLSQPYNIIPSLNEHAVTQPLVDGNYPVLMPYAQGLYEIENEQAEGSVTYLMSTASGAYSKAAGYAASTTQAEDNDLVGTFYPAAAYKSYDGACRFVWFASAHMLDDAVNDLVSGANLDLFMNALNWVCDRERNVSISSRSLDEEKLTVSASQARFWSVVYIGAVPFALLVASGIIIFRRKSR